MHSLGRIGAETTLSPTAAGKRLLAPYETERSAVNAAGPPRIRTSRRICRGVSGGRRCGARRLRAPSCRAPTHMPSVPSNRLLARRPPMAPRDAGPTPSCAEEAQMQHPTTPDPTGAGPAAHVRPEPTVLRRRSVLAGGAVAAGVSLLSSCGATDAAETPLTFWNFYSPAPQQDPNLVAQSEWFQTAIDRWNGENKRQIAPLYMTSDQMNQRMPVAFASGSGPDIFLISPGDYLRYANG